MNYREQAHAARQMPGLPRGFARSVTQDLTNPRVSPGGHLEPTDGALADAAKRELVEETGIDPGAVSCVSDAPVYIEYAKVPARPDKDEPEHFHLDFGYAFVTVEGEIGRVQESEVTGAGWYPLTLAERLVGHRITRAMSAPPDRFTDRM